MRLRVASPCPADWSAMQGDDRVRFCGQCQKNVYNLSAMTHAEAEDLIREKEGKLCVRFYQRTDGTVLTADCPVGRRRRRRRHILIAAGTVGLTAATVAAFVSTATTGRVEPMMGSPRPIPAPSARPSPPEEAPAPLPALPARGRKP